MRLALAIENNLDVEVGRYDLVLAGTDVLRARGGGILRGIDFNVAESPTGVGGPGSPLLNSAASTVTPATPTINELTPLNELTQTQTSLSSRKQPRNPCHASSTALLEFYIIANTKLRKPYEWMPFSRPWAKLPISA